MPLPVYFCRNLIVFHNNMTCDILSLGDIIYRYSVYLLPTTPGRNIASHNKYPMDTLYHAIEIKNIFEFSFSLE